MKLAATPKTRYRATLRLGFFEQVASNDSIAARFLDVGLTEVQVWGSGRDRFVDALWTGAAIEIELPEQITKVVVI